MNSTLLFHRSNRIYWALLGLALLGYLGMHWGFLWPAQQQAQAISQQHQQKIWQERFLKQRGEFSQLFEHSTQQVIIIQEKLKQDFKLNLQKQYIADLSKKRRLTILHESFSEQPHKQQKAHYYRHQIKMQGSYESLYQFLLDLHQLPNWTQVTQARLQPTNNNDLGIELSLITIYSNQESP